MIKHPCIWAFGDSWTAATEVAYEESFSYLLAKRLGYKLINLGRPGSDNATIMKMIQTIRRNFNKNDLIIVGWTTPHRDMPPEREVLEDVWNVHIERRKKLGIDITDIKIPIDKWIEYVNKTIELLEGTKYVMTQAFNPVIGYDYEIEPSDITNSERFMGWGKLNYTMADMITNNYLADNTKSIWMTKDSIRASSNLHMEPFFARDKKHPSVYGHRIIADRIYKFLKISNLI